METLLSDYLQLALAFVIFTVPSIIFCSKNLVDYASPDMIWGEGHEKYVTSAWLKFKRFWLTVHKNFSYVLFFKTAMRMRYTRFTDSSYANYITSLDPVKIDDDDEDLKIITDTLRFLHYFTLAFIWGYLIFVIVMLSKIVKYNKANKK